MKRFLAASLKHSLTFHLLYERVILSSICTKILINNCISIKIFHNGGIIESSTSKQDDWKVNSIMLRERQQNQTKSEYLLLDN